jgi:hypothetical protein
MRAFGRAIVWLFIGLIGSALILLGAVAIIDAKSLPRIMAGTSVSTESWDKGYVAAKGTWVFEEEKSGVPRQTSEINCFRDENMCIEALAEIWFDSDLSVSLYRMPITTWDANTIVFSETSGACVTSVYTITRASRRAVGQRLYKQSSADICKLADAEEPRIFNLTLKDGSVVSEQLRQEVKSNILPFAWAACCFWWAFLIFKIVVRARKDALPHKAIG